MNYCFYYIGYHLMRNFTFIAKYVPTPVEKYTIC